MSTQGSYLEFPTQSHLQLSALRSPVGVVMSLLAAFILLAAIYYFSLPQLLTLAVVGVLFMALALRTTKLQAFSKTYSTHNLDCSDGGAFSVKSIEAKNRKAKPVVSDGGSFERSSVSKTKK